MTSSPPPTSTGSTKLDAIVQRTKAETPEKLSGLALYSRFALAGAICCSVTHGGLTPVDVYVNCRVQIIETVADKLSRVKTRIQLDPQVYNRGMIGGFRQVIANEGAGALLTGFGPTAAGYFLQGAFKFGGYELFKQQFINYFGYETASNNRTAIYLASSAAAEFFADIALCPLEATRIRLVSEPTFANGLLGGFTKIARTEGIGAFYSGFGPILFKQYVLYRGANVLELTRYLEFLTQWPNLSYMKKLLKLSTSASTNRRLRIACKQPSTSGLVSLLGLQQLLSHSQPTLC